MLWRKQGAGGSVSGEDFYPEPKPASEQQSRLVKPGTEANGHVWTGREWVPKPKSLWQRPVSTWTGADVVVALALAFGVVVGVIFVVFTVSTVLGAVGR